MKEMALADRMKFYENYNKHYLMPNQYVLLRLDGKSFSKFTKKYFNKPFDEDFISMMIQTAKHTFNNISGCCAAYVQSDEITFLLTDMKSKGMEAWFNYRVDKICSIAASIATAKFNNLLYSKLFHDIQNIKKYSNTDGLSISEISEELEGMPQPVFDCRAWNVPNSSEVKNVFLWRQRDCIRNSVLQYAQSFFTHTQLMYKNIKDVENMIKNEYSNDSSKWWENLNNTIKYGTFIFKYKEMTNNKNEFVMYHDMMNSPEISPIPYEFDRIFDNNIIY